MNTTRTENAGPDWTLIALTVIMVSAVLAVIAMALALPLMVTPAFAAVPEAKVVVCKYVGSSTETLQTGQNPIEVAQAAMPSEWDGSTFPFQWTDNQNLSVAIGFSGQGLDITDCPGYVAPTEPPPPPTATSTPTATDTPTVTNTPPPGATSTFTPTASSTPEEPQPTSTPGGHDTPKGGTEDFASPALVGTLGTLLAAAGYAISRRQRA